MSVSRRGAAVLGWCVFAVLFGGEALRITASWYGWTAVALVLAVVTAVVTFRGLDVRGTLAGLVTRWRSPAFWIAVFLTLCVVSLIWSDYRGGTVIGIVGNLAATVAALAVARTLEGARLIRVMLSALSTILASSLLFELFVATVIRHPIIPVFPLFPVRAGAKIPDAFYWSRDLLLSGGQIQGVVGNSNLLAFIALLAAITAACAWRTKAVGPATGAATFALALAVLALTRSSTVSAAGVATLVAAALSYGFGGGRGSAERLRHRVVGFAASAVLAAVAVVAVAAPGIVLGAIGKSADFTGRVDIWNSVSALIADRPVLGWGWVSYWQPWIPLFENLAVRKGVVYLQAHNAFLDVTLQLGVLGLVALLALLLSILARALRTLRAGSGTSFPLLVLVALLIQGLAESRLLYEGNWALLVLLGVAGFSVRDGRGTPEQTPSSTPEVGDGCRETRPAGTDRDLNPHP
jgi:exopolysaccharide production protein ExoQ